MMTNGLQPDERRQADRLALEIAGLIRDTPGSTGPGASTTLKRPFVQAVMTRAVYLLGLDGLLVPEPAGSGEDRQGETAGGPSPVAVRELRGIHKEDP